MDPKANIDQQRALAVTLLGKIDTPTDQHGIALSHERLDINHAVGRLCQLVLALDQWRAKAGFDPYQVPSAAHQLDKARAWDAIDEALTRNARGESHASAADVCAVGFAQQQRLRTAKGDR